jgi:hypothetical protein
VIGGSKAPCIGLISFIVVCSIGAVANVGISKSNQHSWWFAGFAGVVAGGTMKLYRRHYRSFVLYWAINQSASSKGVPIDGYLSGCII